ncbi:Oligoribonuclease NrnB or cAMP/cGMP phosphodiesterase, DHH superfamily [Ectopseudomonas chengduensis]|uniref:Oligoribonuclease NrnB or cAMP/cGMP phosphodiesterase, DHH superfamily n=1 Tax=Ectopseudomonas chengduensis TaxID=489632 RepID=A0A1G6NYX2_9GAMM|nr:DHHA1 domain-containing protein [Pseudomonas chengduensis]MBP3063691.1 phosphohydrolase [Pseudomonas chengduensis]NNB73430.1 phosphohydrolase [Pseudomonas chengduensis]SDC72979.1 Oligoribonuclease NrnB or cAMP/cGMP phosphodiesterase, DHH superfamily [Pseudomonas chengduensis]
MKTLCIYHANCADGFGAAWVVRQALGAENVEFHAGHYGKPAPDVEGRDVIIVDFSYPYELLVLLGHQARSILIIDHHKTAAEALAQLPTAPSCFAEWAPSTQRVGTVFDMNRSGAGLTWDYFNPGQPRPALINHIEDRDLWRFKLEGTREIQANLFSYPYDFEVWDALMNTPTSQLLADGKAIERKHHKDVAELVVGSKRRMVIAGFDVPVANLPYIHSSDAGHLMAIGEPFAACYQDTSEHRYFSLRSHDQGLDVGEIAKRYGGGGHRNAAGFKVPFDHELACFATARILTCVYCGHEYPQDTPAAGDQVLTDHIRTCAKHPMREAQQAIAKLHSALAGLVGESTPQGLSQLEVGLKLVPMPATEKALMSAAIQALRDTAGLITATEVQP